MTSGVEPYPTTATGAGEAQEQDESWPAGLDPPAGPVAARLAAIATDLVLTTYERPDAWAYAVSSVRPAQLAIDLGRSRTWLYRSFPTEADLWRALVVFKLERASRLDPAAMLDHEPADADAGDVRPVLDRLVHQAIRTEDPPLFTAIAAYPVPEQLGRIEVARFERAVGHLHAWLSRVLTAQGRRPAPGVHLIDVAEAIQFLIDGCRMARWLSPEQVRHDWHVDGHGRASSMLAATVALLLDRLTEPGPLPPSPPLPRPDAPETAWTPVQLEIVETASRRYLDISHDTRPDLSAVGWVTAAAVARRAGVSRPTVYRYWANDTELRLAVLRELCRRDIAVTRVVLRSVLPTLKTPRDAVDTFIEACVPHAGIATSPVAAFAPYTAHPEVTQALHATMRDLSSQLAATFASQRLQGGMGAQQMAELFVNLAFAVRRHANLTVPLPDVAARTRPRVAALVHLLAAAFGVFLDDPQDGALVALVSRSRPTDQPKVDPAS